MALAAIVAGCSSPHSTAVPGQAARDTTPAASATGAADSSSVEAATAVLRAYYDAIAAHDYRLAYLKWDAAGAASGKSFA